MTKLIEADTRLQAWMDAADYLLAKGPSLNIVLAIADPVDGGPQWGKAVDRIDAFLTDEEEYPLHTVAETIFPAWEYRHRGLRGVFEVYPEEEYPRLMKAHPNRWGTYAHRLVRRTDGEGNQVNPLEQMLDKMKTELGVQGTKKSCYEIGVTEGAYDLPLYNTVDDASRHLGGPCLSHLSFKLFDGEVHLTAVYRSHDYRHKVLGNLLGLARLQACVAQEVGQPLGSLVVHSSYAYLEGAKGRIRSLLDDLRVLHAPEDASDAAAP